MRGITLFQILRCKGNGENIREKIIDTVVNETAGHGEKYWHVLNHFTCPLRKVAESAETSGKNYFTKPMFAFQP